MSNPEQSRSSRDIVDSNPVTPRAELDVEGLPPDLEEMGEFDVAPETDGAPTASERATSERSAEPARPAAPAASSEHAVFARRVASVFSTQVTMFAMAFVTSMLVAGILGTAGKGTYVAISGFPALLSAFAMFGLPSAINYFAGRGVSLSRLILLSYQLTALLAIASVGLVWLLLPRLEGSILSAACPLPAAGAPAGPCQYDDMLRLILVTVPFSFLSAFGGSILYGRQAVKRYNLIQLGTSAFTLVWVVVAVWLLHLGVRAAVWGSVIVTVSTAVLVMGAVHRLPRPEQEQRTTFRKIAGYSARTYPATLSGYFSYRADTYILQASLASRHESSTSPLGLYSLAVTMDEALFYVPNAVATLFLPRVAGMTVEESSVQVGRVGRLTTLITLAAGVALIPAAYILVGVVLRQYRDCLPAFLVLLPGVVSLSVGKVMTSYIGGRGRPGTIAAGSLISVVLNVILNIVLIPVLGIVGASLSSLISYTIQAAIAVYFASRLSGQKPLSLFVPGRGEIALLMTTLPRLIGRVPLINRVR